MKLGYLIYSTVSLFAHFSGSFIFLLPKVKNCLYKKLKKNSRLVHGLPLEGLTFGGSITHVKDFLMYMFFVSVHNAQIQRYIHKMKCWLGSIR